MPAATKKRVLETAKKRERRGRTYLVIALIAIIAVAIGWFVYAASLPPGPPDFTISAPTGVTIHAGTPTIVTINVTTVNRFDGTISLSAASSPAGLTTSISPAEVTGAGTAQIKFSSATNNTYTVTVTGTSGSLTHKVSPTVATPVYATLVTSKGNITIELYRAQVPKTVDNFVRLATSRFYTNLTWHRIVVGFVIQTGDPTTINGTGDRTKWGNGSSQSIPFEYDPSLHNNAGFLGMASSAPGVGGSCQFYINLSDSNSGTLDGKYAVFGKVISGMNAVNSLASVPTTTQYSSAEAPQPVNPADAMLVSVKIWNSA